MRSLPTGAKLFVGFIVCCGLLAAALSRVVTNPHADAEPWELGIFVILGIAVGSKKVRLMRHRGADDVGSMQLGFALTYAAMLRFGPAAAVLVGTLSTLSSCVYPKRQPFYQLCFNVAITAVETFLASVVFLWVNGWTLDMEPTQTFPAVVLSSILSFLINTGAVATVISLCTGRRAFALWRETFLWVGPSYLAGSCITTLTVLILGRHVGAVLLFFSPVAYFTYQSYSVYTAREEEKQQHIEELQGSQARLADLYLATIKSLALAIDAKDQYTHQHILRVQRYAVATAKQMGLTGAEMEGLNTGALLHDIGKLGVPEYVLLKPGRLTDEEFAKIKKHPEIGAAILDPVEFPWPVLPVVKYHHEKWNGTGYPEGLAGENIPLTARILAAADVYDALTSNRSYRNAWSHEKAVALIRKDAGTHFDPQVVEAFLAVIDGVVREMAGEGVGPLVVESAPAKATTKADQAARDIYRASSELWALYEVAQTLSSSLGLQETLEILARKLEAILPGTACLFLLQEEGSEALTARAVIGVNRDFFDGCRTLGGRSRSVEVLRDRRTYLGEYDPDDLLLTGARTAEWVPMETALIVPIVHQGEALGTINLYSPHGNAFGTHDQQLLEMIAERAAMALYNGILFDRTRSHAVTDPLTGLYNARYLTEYVEQRCKNPIGNALTLISMDAPPGFALLCLDLDSFKPINDNFGHQKGDEVLEDLGRLFRETVRKRDIVTRYGGDEFLIVLEDAGAAEAEAMARRIEKAVEEYEPGLIHPRLGALHLGVSIGAACFPGDGTDCTTLISVADAHMYREKTERKLVRLANGGEPRAARLPRLVNGVLPEDAEPGQRAA